MSIVCNLWHTPTFRSPLARLRKAELYTGDSEFKAVEKDLKIVGF